MGHAHVGKVVEWGMDSDYNSIPTVYGCTSCSDISMSALTDEEVTPEHRYHTEYIDGCFGCKARTLQLATGDANVIASGWTGKKWDGELQNFRDAVAQGISPEGTSTKKIQEAVDASDRMGRAYKAEDMPQAKHINKPIIETMKEIGM
jgi:hypothetical protein